MYGRVSDQFNTGNTVLTEFWFDPVDPNRLGSADVSRSAVYVDSKVIDRLDLSVWGGVGTSIQIDRIKVGTAKSDVLLSEYDRWAYRHGLSEGPYGDDDSDGQINLYEYALGGNPTNAVEQGSNLEYSMIRNETGHVSWMNYIYPVLSGSSNGLSYNVELTTNLVTGTWSRSGYETVGTNVTGDSLDFITVHIPVNDASQQFVRLLIHEQ
jgi:hypothetical protein